MFWTVKKCHIVIVVLKVFVLTLSKRTRLTLTYFWLASLLTACIGEDYLHGRLVYWFVHRLAQSYSLPSDLTPSYLLPVTRVIVGRINQILAKSCTLGCKHETLYNYGLRNAHKNWKRIQAAGHCYDLPFGHFRSKTDIFGDFYIWDTFIKLSRSMKRGTSMV